MPHAEQLDRIERKLDHLAAVVAALVERELSEVGQMATLSERLSLSNERLKQAVNQNQPSPEDKKEN